MKASAPMSASSSAAAAATTTAATGASQLRASYTSAFASPALGMPMLRAGNSISLDGPSSFSTSSGTTSSRKRPLELLSPLPSPLLSFLSTPSSSSSMPGPALSSMNMIDLSLRLGPSASSMSPFRGNHGQATAEANSLKFVVPAAAKRVRRESPGSPRSVGEVGAQRSLSQSPPAAAVSSSVTTASSSSSAASRPPPAPSASLDKIRSVVRGLEHVSRCTPSGCGNPLCVSTRGFVNKVSAHLVAIANKPGHLADKCGACQLWKSIVSSHTAICMEAQCSIPLCASSQPHDVPPQESTTFNSIGCRRRDRRDDNDDQRFPMIALQ